MPSEMCCSLAETKKALAETVEANQTEDRYATKMPPLVLSAEK
jgi:hypothetical protein